MISAWCPRNASKPKTVRRTSIGWRSMGPVIYAIRRVANARTARPGNYGTAEGYGVLESVNCGAACVRSSHDRGRGWGRGAAGAADGAAAAAAASVAGGRLGPADAGGAGGRLPGGGQDR